MAVSVCAQDQAIWTTADIVRLRDAGKTDSALAVADSLLAHDSLRIDVLMRRSDLRRVQGDGAGALADLRRALIRVPMSAEVHSRIAEWFAHEGNFDSAAVHSGIALGRLKSAEKDRVLRHAEYLEKSGHTDSAVTILHGYWQAQKSRSLGMLPPVAGWRPAVFELVSLAGTRQLWNTARPSIFLFWSPSIEPSLQAMADIQAGLRSSGVTWQFIPMTVGIVDSATVATARAHNYTGALWVDSGNVIMDAWGIPSLPTVVFTGIGGEITSVVTHWNDRIRDVVLKRELGSYTDTVDAPPTPADTGVQRAQNLLGVARRAWQTGNLSAAIQQAGRAAHADPMSLNAPLHLALWRWEAGDTVGARLAIQGILAKDSLDSRALTLAAMILWWQGRSEQAVETAQRVLRLNTASVPAWWIMGWDAANRNDHEKAMRSVTEIDAVRPGDWRVGPLQAMLLQASDPTKALGAWRVLVNGL